MLQQQRGPHLKVDVWVEDLGLEADLGRGQRVLLGHLDGQVEERASVHRVCGALQRCSCSFPGRAHTRAQAAVLTYPYLCTPGVQVGLAAGCEAYAEVCRRLGCLSELLCACRLCSSEAFKLEVWVQQ